MGGIWTPPVKLLDGIWFAVDGAWLGDDVATTRYTSGWGYQRFDYAGQDGLSVGRLDFAPDGARANVIGLTLRSESRRTVSLAMDAHSELMPNYPWGWTTPSAADVNLPDTGAYTDGSLTFREDGTSPGLGEHDYAAVVGSSARPSGHQLGANHRGPQDPAVVCPAEGDAPPKCDDSAFGKGTGGRLTYDVALKPGKATTLWFTVAGSDQGPAAARAEYLNASKNPERALRSKLDGRLAVAGHTKVDLPGDRLLQRSVDWSKQNLADSVQDARDLKLRDVDEGKAYPEPAGTLKDARWYGAGFPDYPWMFGTDGEYTAFAAVAAGQFEPIKAHLRGLRDVSEIVNERSGKLVHEIVHTGDVYFGANDDAGNTDETVKFPSAVALVWRWTGDDRFRDDLYDFTVRNLRYVDSTLDADGDGWLEGLGNVERPGMGVEKLDSTAYYIRGLLDLADMAASKGDSATQQWAGDKAADLRSRFEAQWWAPGDAKAYAESIDDPADPANDNTAIFQRHWTGVSPMEIELPDGSPLASAEHGTAALAQREKDCYTGEFGLYHTGSGPTSRSGGQPRPVLRQRGVLGEERALDVLAQHRRDGGRRGQLRPARRAADVHHRQRAHPARPVGLGDAGCDAGDLAVAGLPGEHRPADVRPLDVAAGLGRLRDPLAGGPPAARRRAGPGQRPAVGDPAAARRPGPHRRVGHPARRGRGGRQGLAQGRRARDVGPARPPPHRPHRRRGAAGRQAGHQGDLQRPPGGLRGRDHRTRHGDPGRRAQGRDARGLVPLGSTSWSRPR